MVEEQSCHLDRACLFRHLTGTSVQMPAGSNTSRHVQGKPRPHCRHALLLTAERPLK
jgi:hypothetical protein